LPCFCSGTSPGFLPLSENFRAEASRIHYYIFDLLCCKDCDLTRLPLIERRGLMKSLVMIHDKRIRISEYVEAGATELPAAVREQHLQGIVGKRKDSPYQPGKRSGAWIPKLGKGLLTPRT
jgi:bifunctional non-homologous end joining protein LigD